MSQCEFDIAALKALLVEVMPILDYNLNAAHEEHMSGQIAAGAFHYVLARHGNACTVIAKEDINPEAAFEACARITPDLRCGCRDLKKPEPLEKWMAFFRAAGFTEDHPFFDFPMRPKAEAAA
jgi:hypothetical protein